MKTQRRRGRANNRVLPPANSPLSNGTNGTDDIGEEDGMDGELPYAASLDSAESGDGITAQLEAGGPTNGRANGHANDSGSGNGSDNGHTAEMPAAPRHVVPNLPRRRPRPEPTSTASTASIATEVAPPSISKGGKARSGVSTLSPISPIASTTIYAPAAPAKPRESLPAKAFRLVVTYENAIYLGIFLLAIVTRFWDVGNRGIHHDESLHSVYSRNLYIGNGYTHDPMMHGPIQFHWIALMDWLFGDTDATTRFASVLSGIWVVMSPFFLRRQMGRWPALIASFLFLTSPLILYFSRMAREDSIFSAMEMIMIVGLWRFVSTRRPADFFVFMAGLSLMFTIKETAYLTLAIMLVLFVTLFAVQAGYAVLGALAGYGAAMGAFYLFISSKMKGGEIPKLPDIPATNPDFNTIISFVGNLMNHSLIQGVTLITLLFVGLIIGLLTARTNTLVKVIVGWVAVLVAVRVLLHLLLPDSYLTLAVQLGALILAFLAGIGLGFLVTRGGKLHLAKIAPESFQVAVLSQVIRRRPVRPANGSAAAPLQGRTLPSRRVRTTPVEPDAVVASTGGNGHEVALDEPRVNSVEVATDTGNNANNGISNGNGAANSQWLEEPAAYADPNEATEVWDPRRLDPKPGTLLAHYQPGSIPHLIGALFSRPSVILIGFLIAATIFTVLYTVFFTDVPRGIVSGLFASLGYWMAQQGVARGGQPWYYYFLIIPLYEPIAVFFGLAATAFFGVKGIRGLLNRRAVREETGEPGLGLFNLDRSVPFASFSAFLPLFIISWLGGAVILYSWAGEKMPWLTSHMVRPAILLASLFLGALLASLIKNHQERLAYADAYADAGATVPLADIPPVPTRRPLEEPAIPQRRPSIPGKYGKNGAIPAPPPRRRVAAPVAVIRTQEPPWVTWNAPGSRFPAISFVIGFVVLALGWGMKLNELTAKSAANHDYKDWGVNWVFPILMLVLVVAYAVWLGPMRSLKYLAVGIFSVLFLYQFRSATNLSYQHPDVSVEMASYVQTSPDTTRVVKEINDYSVYATGGTNLKVIYNWFPSWPFEWYLRDFKNKQFIDHNEPSLGADAPIIILDYAAYSSNAKLMKDYVVQRYAMRWWFPEDWYKNDLVQLKSGEDLAKIPASEQVGRILNTTAATVTNPSVEATLWKYLIFRQTPHPLGSEDMVVAVRKDIVQQYHYIQYQPPVIDDVQPEITNNPPIMSDDERYR